MANEWRTVTLGEVLGPKGYIRGPFGSALKRGELLSEGVPVYEQQHAIYSTRDFRFFIGKEKYQELARFTVQPNDLIISCSGTLGRVSVIRERDPIGVISQALLILRPDVSYITPTFLFYILSSPAGFHSMVSVSTGSVQVNIAKRSIIESIEINLPPLAEQKAIAAMLGSLDDKIELNRRMTTTLEATARTLFQSWFVDFVPIYAKQGGESATGQDPAIAAMFPERLEETPFGQAPQGWEVRSLDKAAHYLNGLALQKYPPGDGPTLPVIKIAQLRKGDTVGADRCNIQLPSAYIVQDGEVLFSWSGSLEVELWCGGLGALNQHLFKVTSTEFPKWFYYLWTLHHLDEFRLIAAGKATTMGHIQRGHLTAAKVLIPPPALLDSMTRIMSPLIEQIISSRIQSRSLATLRDTLLPKLLSGEIRIDGSRTLESRDA